MEFKKQSIRLEHKRGILRQKSFPSSIGKIIPSNQLDLIRVYLVVHVLNANFARSNVAAAKT